MPPMLDLLSLAVRARRNLLVTGGTGSGKTTTLAALAAFVPAAERLVTIEDAAELRIPLPHVVRLESRPPSLEGAGAVSIRALVRNALRMRPDRIVVGEVRGGEALDMLTAMTTGHEGSLSTLHASSPADAVRRVQTLALMGDLDLPYRAVADQVASALDLIVHQARLPDGARRVVEVAAVDAGPEGPRLTSLVRWSPSSAGAASSRTPRPRRPGASGSGPTPSWRPRRERRPRGRGTGGRLGACCSSPGWRGSRPPPARRPRRSAGRDGRRRARWPPARWDGGWESGSGGRASRSGRTPSSASSSRPRRPPPRWRSSSHARRSRSRRRWASVVAAAASVVRSADRRHLARVEAQLPGVAQQLAAALQAGLSLRQALARAARDAPEPCRQELARAVDELALGSRLEAALEGLAARVPVHDLRIMVTAILVQRRTGGNLARALSGLAVRLEERGQLARELRGATAQARMTAWLVAALPLGAAVMAEVAAPGTLARVLGEGPGLPLLAASLTLYGAGVLWIRRIGRVEP